MEGYTCDTLEVRKTTNALAIPTNILVKDNITYETNANNFLAKQ